MLLVGRLVYEKGFQFALEALPRDHRATAESRFLVAGSGTHEEELRRQADELGPDGARHVPRLDRRRRAALALPDRGRLRGPLDLRAVRARRAGGDGLQLPCIVADTGGLREVVPHDEVGLRFRARDPQSLAQMTVRVLDDAKLCRRLTAEAFEHLRRFDWADVAERTEFIYEELAGSRDPAT